MGFGSTHRPFMEQRSYFKSRLEIENKLDHARPLLKMICKDKWKCLERKLKKKQTLKHPGSGTAKEHRAGDQRKGKECWANGRAQARQPKRRQIRKPVQDSKSEPAELTSKTPGIEKMPKMPHFLMEAQPKAPDTETHELKSRSARARWAVPRYKPNSPPVPPSALSSSLSCCNTPPELPPPAGTQGNWNWGGAGADSLFQGKAPSIPTRRAPPLPRSSHTHYTQHLSHFSCLLSYVEHGLKHCNRYAELISV